jgi:hypothetical protein
MVSASAVIRITQRHRHNTALPVQTEDNPRGHFAEWRLPDVVADELPRDIYA